MSRPDTQNGDVRRVDFLAGLSVLEVGDGVAGAAATSILFALGAEVTAVVDPASPHRRGRPTVGDGNATSLLSVILNRGKRLVPAQGRGELEELLDDSASGFDVVIVDRVLGTGGPLGGLADPKAYAAFVDQHNRRSWLTISAFGLTGERARDVGTELTVSAAGGMLSIVRDPQSGRPLKLAGQQSLLNAGQAAALAACHAYDLGGRGQPAHLDLSAVEAAVAMGPLLEVGGLLLATGSPGGAKRYGSPADFYECLDGHIRISAMEDHQWQGVVAAMDTPEWTEKFASVQSRIDGAGELDARVTAWTRTQTKEEAEHLLQDHGVPATAVYSPAEILESPQLAHRDAFEALPVDGGREGRVVGLPFRTVGRGLGSRTRSLRGLRMLEASHVLAAPLAGAILATLGVEVTKLEDVQRLDMYRRRGPYIEGEPGMERSAYFALMNHSKSSAAFDVDAHRDRLEAIVASSDVVLENLGAKRARSIGLSSSTVLEDHPDVLVVSSSGFGQDGPYAGYRAYAYNLQASCGLGYLTRNEEGEGGEIDIAWADLVSGYALATIIASWAVGPSGNAGTGVDFAMADLIVAHFNDFVAAISLGTADDEVDRANELSPYAPNGVYPSEGGWIAISVDGDEQFAGLVKVTGAEALTDPAFTTAAGRFEHRRILDDHVGAVTASRHAADLAGELRSVGVFAEVVRAAADLVESPQLTSRGFFVRVDHPVWGQRRLVGVPWRPFGGPALALGPPPELWPLDDGAD